MSPNYYGPLSRILFAAASPFLWTHPKIRTGIKERFGLFEDPGIWDEDLSPRLWFHGASAGDLLALRPMIVKARQSFVHPFIAVTSLTNSGMLMADKRLANLVNRKLFVPYDLPGATARTCKKIRPQLLILEYTELWPNLIHAVKSIGAKVMLVNGRLTPENLRKYQLLNKVTGHVLDKVDMYLMREESEAERALALGIKEEKIHVTGNTKFDALLLEGNDSAADAPPISRESCGIRPQSPVFFAGSTHDGEEELILDVFKRLRVKFPQLRLVFAPRYLERVQTIKTMAISAGWKTALKSQPDPTAEIIILDTIGELSRAYAVADLVFVGGSFIKRGGQNILEPAAQKKPVLFGPYMHNFSDSMEILLGRGGLQVTDPDHLYQLSLDLLGNPKQMEILGQLAFDSVKGLQGASMRNMHYLKNLLKQS